MFGIFKCQHKAKHLRVKKANTSKPHEEHPKDFIVITYHFICANCMGDVDIECAHLIGTAGDFLNRKESSNET